MKKKASIEENAVVRANDKQELKRLSAPFESACLDPGERVVIPQLTYTMTFVLGMAAICAMILPGISGSYLLLMLGGYFYLFNSIRGFLTGLMRGEFWEEPLLNVVVFGCGAVVGLMLFSRLLAFLLKKCLVPTMFFLSGLMIGALRGIWPFVTIVNEQIVAVWPSWNSANLTVVLVGVIGFCLSFLLSRREIGLN